MQIVTMWILVFQVVTGSPPRGLQFILGTQVFSFRQIHFLSNNGFLEEFIACLNEQ